jgi:polar amino acid transport system permease protein
MWLDRLSLLLDGALVTAQIGALAALLAFVLAVPAGLVRSRSPGPGRALATCYIELFRGTSLIVQLFWLYFVLPQFGLALPAKAVAVLGLGLNYGAYGAEIVRGALLAVPKGQIEAGRSMTLTRAQVLLLIVLPQALVAFVRPWGNLMVQLLKATSLVSLITIADLSYRAYQLNQVTMRTFEIFGAVLVIYFAMAQLIALATDALDRRCGRWRSAGVVR